MIVRKAFAILVILFVLGVQTWTILPPGYPARGWHWPFMDYPMYAWPRRVGDSLIRHDLRYGGCSDSAEAIPVSAADLKLKQFRLWAMLGLAVDERSQWRASAIATADTINTLVRGVKPDACRLEIWRQVFIVEPEGFRDFDQPWQRFRTFANGSFLAPDSRMDRVIP